jgi:hypothetical protein
MAQENDGWVIVAGEADGQPRMYSVRQELPADIDQAAFAECVIIEWRFANEGWPDTRQNAIHKAFAGFLEPLSRSANSLLVHTYTGGGMKEWCYQVKDYDEFMEALNQLLDGKPRFPIEIMHDNDPTWKYNTGITRIALNAAALHTSTSCVDRADP